MQGVDEAEFITLARVTKTQGRRGEVAATLFTDFPERFASRKQLLGLDSKGQRHELELEDHWPHKGQIVLKFAGVDSISQAEMLIGWEIQISRSQRAQLEGDQVYISDLVDCSVYDGNRLIGTIQEVLLGSGEAPLLVVRGQKEYLVPFAASYIEEMALDQKQVRMKLPEGLLDLDSSLKQDALQLKRKGPGPEQL
jgi:16S rRNA processing protein RimM